MLHSMSDAKVKFTARCNDNRRYGGTATSTSIHSKLFDCEDDSIGKECTPKTFMARCTCWPLKKDVIETTNQTSKNAEIIKCYKSRSGPEIGSSLVQLQIEHGNSTCMRRKCDRTALQIQKNTVRAEREKHTVTFTEDLTGLPSRRQEVY